MIFVTVGTHEASFDRLIRAIDDLKASGRITETVIVQTGYSRFEPRHCEWRNFFSYQDMVNNIANARIVITHGGPSSFIMPLQIGKIPIVIPRQKEFGEHVNDHQLNFCKIVESRLNNIILIEDVSNLGDAITCYDQICSEKNAELNSNNSNFNRELIRLIEELM